MKQKSTKTSAGTTLFKKWMIVLLLATAGTHDAFAQCAAPNFVSHSTTSATCQANGSITVTPPSSGMGDYPEYALYDAAGTTFVRPWQVGVLFSDLAPGSYTLSVRYVCGAGFSPIYNKSIFVGGNYVAPAIINITTRRRSQCDNGRIHITATGSNNQRTYALVASLSAAEPVAAGDYIRPPQSSNIFDSLPAGTHYARVYDTCGSYATQSFTVDAYTQSDPFYGNSLSFRYLTCDSLVVNTNTFSLGDYVQGTADTLRKLWIRYPDGSTDTLTPTSFGYYSSHYVPFSKLGPVGPGAFPDNIGGSWPKAFHTGYKDACGNIFTRDYQLGFPVLSAGFGGIAPAYSTCDSIEYLIRVRSTVSPGQLNLNSIRLNADAMYSLDSGSTWQQVMFNSSGYPVVTLARDTAYDLGIAYCGDTLFSRNYVGPLLPFSPGIYESNLYACVGNSGFQISTGDGITPVLVEMLSGPSGQAWVTDTLEDPNGIIYLTSSRNMLLGQYVFRFTDACGRVKIDTVNAVYPFQPFDFDYSFPCGSTAMELSFTNDSFHNFFSSQVLSMWSTGSIKAQIYRAADSTPAITSPPEFLSNFGKLIIPGSVISSLPNGDYFIRAWKNGVDSCTYVDKPWQKTTSLISLNNSLTVSACPGTVSTGTVIAIAQGTGGGESYTLYQDSVSNATMVAGPQASAIFNGLDEATTYVVTVSDSCGRGTQASVSFGSTPLPVYNNAAGFMPCPGDSLALFVNEMPEVTYQWYKNDTMLAGDTLHRYVVSNIEMSDSGAYKVLLFIGTCNVFSSSFRLSPNECGIPLPITLSYFTAKAVNSNVMLQWGTATERLSKGFAIERSANGTDWSEVGYTASGAEGGNSSQPLHYIHIDRHPLNGVNYYRLRQLDLDGRSTYSEVRQVAFRADGQNLLFYPNPASHGLHVEGLEGGETIKVYNALGQLVHRQYAAAPKAYLDFGALQGGTYQVQVTAPSGTSTTHKVIKSE